MKNSKSNIVVFSHIEKTGGTTLIQLLRAKLGVGHVDLIPYRNLSDSSTISDIKRAHMFTPGLRSVAGHSLRPFEFDLKGEFGLSWSALLRDPTARYVSDFFHFTRHMAFPEDFELWLAWRDRYNYQSKSLVGHGNIDTLVQSFIDGEILLGTLANINDFARKHLQRCQIEIEYPLVLEAKNKGTHAVSKSDEVISKYEDEILARNEIDQQLYKSVLDVENHGTLVDDSVKDSNLVVYRDKTLQNRLWRNLVYKPLCLHNPLQTHGLKSYLEFATWSSKDWREYISSRSVDRTNSY